MSFFDGSDEPSNNNNEGSTVCESSRSEEGTVGPGSGEVA